MTPRTVVCVSAVSKRLNVYFYVIEPAPPSTTFVPGSYPLSEVVDRVRQLDPAAEDYRLKEDLWGGETLCLLHEDGPQMVLGAYYKDKLAKALTERKGLVRELELEDDEGLVDAAYGALFPSDVVGLVRTSSKAPGFAKVGQWLSVYGGHPCGLVALPDINTLAQLDQAPTQLRRLRLRLQRSRLASIDAYSHGVANALRAAAEVNSETDVVGLDLAVDDPSHRTAWAFNTRQDIEELLEVLPDFEEATVQITGLRRPVNLKRMNVAANVTVLLMDTKRVGPREAADALFSAYEQERGSIETAVRARRERHHEDPPPGD